MQHENLPPPPGLGWGPGLLPPQGLQVGGLQGPWAGADGNGKGGMGWVRSPTALKSVGEEKNRNVPSRFSFSETMSMPMFL